MQVYKILQMVGGRMVVTTPADIYAWAATIERKVNYIPERSARYLRPEVRNQPRIQGFCGPMWDGFNKDGVAVIRYEDSQSNDILSR